MYATKRLGIREGIYPKRFLTPAFAREFFDIVKHNGRNHEGSLLLRVYLKTNPLMLLKQMGVGMKLWLRGRINVTKDRIRQKEQFQTLLRSITKETMIKRRDELVAKASAACP